jgi:hypothetical protein
MAEDRGRTAAEVADRAQRLSEHLLSRGISGVGPFKGAAEVAGEHLRDASDSEEAIRRLIRTHVRLAASSGFVTGLGGLAALPVTLPAGVTGLYLLGARLSAAVAHLRGYDVASAEVQSAVLVTLLGSAGAEALKKAGIEIGKKSTTAALCNLPGTVLVEINKKVGYRLLSKFGRTGVLNLGKAVPVVGGVIGASVDGVACQSIGIYAKAAFPPVGHPAGIRLRVESHRPDRP